MSNATDTMDRKLEHTNIEKLKALYRLETKLDPDQDPQGFYNWAMLNTLINTHNLLIDVLNIQADHSDLTGKLSGGM